MVQDSLESPFELSLKLVLEFRSSSMGKREAYDMIYRADPQDINAVPEAQLSVMNTRLFPSTLVYPSKTGSENWIFSRTIKLKQKESDDVKGGCQEAERWSVIIKHPCQNFVPDTPFCAPQLPVCCRPEL